MKFKNSLTTNLIVVISGFYIVANYAPRITWGNLTLQENLLLINKAIFPDGQWHGVFAGEWWRIFTVVLTHQSWLHLGMNMVVLFQLGLVVERYFGRSRYLLLLIASTAGASFASLALDPAVQASVGASGMIFGLFGAIAISGKNMGIDYRQAMGYLVFNLVLGFAIPNVDWHAHVGGLIAGLLTAWLLRSLPRRQLHNYWE